MLKQEAENVEPTQGLVLLQVDLDAADQGAQAHQTTLNLGSLGWSAEAVAVLLDYASLSNTPVYRVTS